jgi:Phosphatidylinositol 3- and 4-kinase.
MAEPIEITEIIRPAEQGRSGPYICMGEDNRLYYVKGRNTGRRSQITEWVCAHLATALGLPIAPFSLVNIVPELLAETPDAMREVGAGLAFGSQECPKVLWFEQEHVGKIEKSLQGQILIFDWWVRNCDRLTTNSNLLWDAVRGQLVVIDHNLAFDRDFNARDFLDFHIFGHRAAGIWDDLLERAHYQDWLRTALPVVDEALAQVPDEWWWFDNEQTVAADFDEDTVRELLSRCETDNFWRVA